jgi:hypothetical protein
MDARYLAVRVVAVGKNVCLIHKVWELRLTEYRGAVFTGGNVAH